MKKMIVFLMLLLCGTALAGPQALDTGSGDLYPVIGSATTDSGSYIKPSTDGDCIRVYDSGGTDYGMLCHDGTNFNFTSANTTYFTFDKPLSLSGATSQVDGSNGAYINFNQTDKIRFGHAGGTNNEVFDIDLDGTSNVADVTTSSGITIWDFSDFDIKVSDEAYGAGWNGSLEVPTKNAVYDKIETLGAGTTTRSIWLRPETADVTSAFVVRTPTSGDASVGATIDASEGPRRILFDASTDEAAVFQLKLPPNWSAHGTLGIDYTMASATSGTVEFEGDCMCVTPGDSAVLATASFAGVAVASGTVPGTAGHMAHLDITITDDSCAAGDLMYIYLSTDANDGTNDTATGDREVVGVEYKYTG